MTQFDETTPSPFSDFSDEIVSIKISSGIQSIGTNAFSGCEFLEKVEIAETVTSIGTNAFGDCQNLRKVTFWGKSDITCDTDVFGELIPLEEIVVMEEFEGKTFCGKDVVMECGQMEYFDKERRMFSCPVILMKKLR